MTGEPRSVSEESSDHVTACSEVRAKGCQRRFVVGDVEHTCASRVQHQPRRVHVCLCGARRIEQ